MAAAVVGYLITDGYALSAIDIRQILISDSKHLNKTMSEIKFGDISYFTLLRLQDTLKSIDFNRLRLLSFDKLRNEVDMKVDQIDHEEKERRKKQKI